MIFNAPITFNSPKTFNGDIGGSATPLYWLPQSAPKPKRRPQRRDLEPSFVKASVIDEDEEALMVMELFG